MTMISAPYLNLIAVPALLVAVPIGVTVPAG